MLELIKRKVEGEDITIAPTRRSREHKIIDLMEALKASLAAGNARKPAQQAEPAAEKKAAKPKPAAKKRVAAK